MIYQCYFKPEQKQKLFSESVYAGFGLEPEVNDQLFKNCPELQDKHTRLQLTEYACFLWHWRNPEADKDNWFGTTSYRQLDKTPFKFENSLILDEYTKNNYIVVWGVYKLMNSNGLPISLAKQSDICHPGINNFIEIVLKRHGEKIPKYYYELSKGAYANYWAMNKKMFNEYMEYSWPLVSWALNNQESFDYFKKDMPGITVTKEKAVGYFMERLFLIWYLKHNHKLVSSGPIIPLYHGC
jgi:hypothetical protein